MFVPATRFARCLLACLALTPLAGTTEIAELEAVNDELWAPFPDGTVATLYVSGADLGWTYGRGCHGGNGGTVVRPRLEAHLAEHHADIARAWVSTGSVLHPTDKAGVDNAAALAIHGQMNYAAVGVSLGDLAYAGHELAQRAAESGVQLLATNLLILETGRSPFSDSRVIELGDLRIGLVSILFNDETKVWGGESSGSWITVDSAAAVKRALDEMGDVDHTLLLSESTLGDVRAVLKSEPRIDMVVTHNGPRYEPWPIEIEGRPVQFIGSDALRLGRISFDADGEVLEMRAFTVRDPFPVKVMTGEIAPEE